MLCVRVLINIFFQKTCHGIDKHDLGFLLQTTILLACFLAIFFLLPIYGGTCTNQSLLANVKPVKARLNWLLLPNIELFKWEFFTINGQNTFLHVIVNINCSHCTVHLHWQGSIKAIICFQWSYINSRRYLNTEFVKTATSDARI